MRYLAIDYGRRNIGIAVSDKGGALAFPHTIITNDSTALAQVMRVIGGHTIERIIVGDTRADNGTHNEITSDAGRFAEALEQESGIPVESVSESWSSFEAARYAPGDVHDDSVAAAIILQRYIDMHANNIEVSNDELE